MTQYVCDRCREISATPHKTVEIPSSYELETQHDLCISCLILLEEFLKPLPLPQPDKQDKGCS